MTVDPFTKLRRVDRCLAMLNFLLAGTNLLFFPCCSCGWCFAWSMNDMPQQHPEALPLFGCMGGTVLLGGSLCLGFVAGISLLRDRDRSLGRTLSRILIFLAGFHLLLAPIAYAMVMGMDFSRISERSSHDWLGGLVFFGPSLLYCIAAPILLIMRHSIRPLDPLAAAEAARLPRQPFGDSAGIVEESRVLGTSVDRPTKRVDEEGTR
jgi:hypothetical protein